VIAEWASKQVAIAVLSAGLGLGGGIITFGLTTGFDRVTHAEMANEIHKTKEELREEYIKSAPYVADKGMLIALVEANKDSISRLEGKLDVIIGHLLQEKKK